MFKDATEYDKLKAELISLYRSQASKGRKQSKEEIEKRTQSMLKFYNSSAGKLACKKQSIALKAWKRPDSVGQNISKAKKVKNLLMLIKKHWPMLPKIEFVILEQELEKNIMAKQQPNGLIY